MKYFFSIIICSLILASCATKSTIQPTSQTSQNKVDIDKNVCADVNCFKKRLLKNNSASITEIDNFFTNVTYKDSIIRIMNRPGTSNPWYVFQKNNVSKAIINQGIDFYNENQNVLETVAKRFQVDPEYIVAILGIETHYGKLMGSDRVADSLYTLAFFYPRRAETFQNELEQFFLMGKENHRDLFSYKGSFAGAMGYPQFMPSSYRQWAVSYNSGNSPDIWNNVADAVSSVGNYLKVHGWTKNQTVVFPVVVNNSPEIIALVNENTALKHTIKELRAKGVSINSSIPDNQKGFLFKLETAPGEFSYYVGLTNFYAIWKYNNSRMYVLAVDQIADGIRQGIKQ